MDIPNGPDCGEHSEQSQPNRGARSDATLCKWSQYSTLHWLVHRHSYPTKGCSEIGHPSLSSSVAKLSRRVHMHIATKDLYRVGPQGFDSGKGEKLSNSHAACLAGDAWALLSFSSFPVSNSVFPPCNHTMKFRALTYTTVAV